MSNKWLWTVSTLACGVILARILFLTLPEKAPSVSTEKTYISANPGGQLGNQMFNFAAVLAYAWDHELTPIFPSLNSSSVNLSYNRDNIFFRLDSSTPPVTLTPYTTAYLNYEPFPDDLKNVVVEGGCFSWKYFDHHRDKIIAQFAPSEALVNKLTSQYADLLSKENTVAVHVRTYSKRLHEEGGHFAGFKYFTEALNQFPNDATFVVFSDRINWAEANFKKRFPEKNFVFIRGDNHIDEFILMSMMKHQILSKSTFSWWAAYLNKNPDKLVYHPRYVGRYLPDAIKTPIQKVMRKFGKVVWIDEEYHLPEWKALPYEIEPYPEDIYDYGDESASVFHLDK